MLRVGIGPVVIRGDNCAAFNFAEAVAVDMTNWWLDHSVDTPRDFLVFCECFDDDADPVFA